MKEEYLPTGSLVPTNEFYAFVNVAGIKMREPYNRQHSTSYTAAMPTNLYGPGDNCHPENSPLTPARFRKFHLVKLAIQGDLKGIQQGEAQYGPTPLDIKQDTCLKPDASSFLNGYNPSNEKSLNPFPNSPLLTPNSVLSFLNIGTGLDCTIVEATEQVGTVFGSTGEVVYDLGKPDGTPQRILDTT